MTPNQEIASIIAQFAERDGEYSTAIPNLYLSRKSAPSQPLYVAQWPCFALVAQGAKRLSLSSEIYDYGVGDYLLLSLDLPVVSVVTDASPEEPNLGIGLRIDPEMLSDLLRRTDLPRPTVAADGMRGVAVSKAGPELLDATVRLMRLLHRPKDIPALAPLIQQEILYWLLTGPDGPRLLSIAMSESHGNRIAKAVAWLRDNFTQPLRIEDLAERVGMSVSSFHHHFKAVTAMTPMQYQKRFRLNEARRLMLVENLDVGSAGYRVGYESASQFNREYSRNYGMPPLKDVGRIRELTATELQH